MSQRSVPGLSGGARLWRRAAARAPLCAAGLAWGVCAAAGAQDFGPAPDEPRLAISQSLRLGPEVVAAQRHVSAGSLNAAQAWRSEIDATLTAVTGADFTSQLRIGVFNTQRPFIRSRGGFGLEDFNLWRSNSVIDAGLAFSVYDSRLNFASGVASSETALLRHSSEEPWLRAFEAGAGDYRRRASAFFQKLDARIIDREEGKFSISALYTKTGQDFRSFQTNALTNIDYEGESINGKASVEIGKTTLSLEKNAHDDRYQRIDENILRFAPGAVSIKVTATREEMHEGALVFYSDEIFRTTLRFDLNRIAPAGPAWLPDTLTFGSSQRAAMKPSLFNSEDATRRAIGIGAAKSGDHFTTDVYFYWSERSDLASAGGHETSREFGADLVQSFSFDDWDLSLYAMMSDMTRRLRAVHEGDERQLSAGISFEKRFERLPDVRLSFDAFRYATGSVRADDAFESHDLELRAEFDVSERVLSGLSHVVDARRPYSILVGVYRGWSLSDDAIGPATRDSDTRLLVTMRRAR